MGGGTKDVDVDFKGELAVSLGCSELLSWRGVHWRLEDGDKMG